MFFKDKRLLDKIIIQNIKNTPLNLQMQILVLKFKDFLKFQVEINTLVFYTDGDQL